jgi:hypothetical protein
MDDKLLDALNKLGEPATVYDQGFLFRGLIYGDPGAGKTDLAIKIADALTPEDKKICLIFADSNWTTVLKYPEIAKRVMKYPFEGFSQIRAILAARDEGIEPYCDFGSIVWDTWSTSVDQVLRQLVDQRKYPKEQHDPEVEGWPHYRLVERGFIDLIKLLLKSNIHVVYTAHERWPTEADLKKGKVANRPQAPEATYNVLARDSNMIGFLFKEDPRLQRYLRLNGSNQVKAKCQIPGLNEVTYKVEDVVSKIKELAR